MASSSSNPHSTPARTANVPPLLLCEALGFSPQLLLDDIINIANNAVQDGVNGMEEFLNKWADERMALEAGARTTSTLNADADATTHEVEQGLVAFQTLLEYHTDIAFDFFEAWCLRNIFMIPTDLPVVLPHQAGLDLTVPLEREQELVDEVEELRKQLDAQRKLKRVLLRAVRTSARQRQHAEARLASLSALTPSAALSSSGQDPAQDPLHALPSKILAMHRTLAALPPPDVPARAPGAQPDPGKRPWETSRAGYLNWALGSLVARAEAADGAGPVPTEDGAGGARTGAGTAAVDAVQAGAAGVGTSAELQRALAAVDAVGAVRKDLEGVRSLPSQAQSQTQTPTQSQTSSRRQSQSGVPTSARRQSQGSSQGQSQTQGAGQRRQSLIPSQNRRREGDKSRDGDADVDGDVPMEED